MFDLGGVGWDNRCMSERKVRATGPTARKRRLSRTGAGILALSLGLSATVVASSTVSHRPAVEINSLPKAKLRWFQIGKASWYGKQFQGKETADGEHFDMNSLTCAHRTLPLGSWIRVTNLRNKRSAFVRVNDRGPEPLDRVIDLSYAAAQRIGLAGIGKVKIEPVSPSDSQLTEALVNQLPLLPLAPVVLNR
jgi:rare lipoprotein A